MKSIGVIPARLESKRFPQKLLKDVLGKPLIQRTYENALKCKSLDALYIATDSDLIEKIAEDFSANVIKTKACENGTERIAHAIESLDNIEPDDVIINIQGDHPCIIPSTIDAMLMPFDDPAVLVTTPLLPIKDLEKASLSSIVKCVFDKYGKALYFSRSIIPCNAKECYQHLGVYAYRKAFLTKLNELPNTPLQLKEDLEQLKILEHGYAIHTVVVNDAEISVDIPDDLINLKRYLCEQNTYS